MDVSNPQDPIARQPRKRQNREEYDKVHRPFLEHLWNGTNQREIKHILGLSASQFKNHLLDALTTGELTGPPKAAGYAILPVRALQHRDRDELKNMLQLGIRDMDLLKFEKRGNEIICSIIPAADSTLSEEEVEIS